MTDQPDREQQIQDFSDYLAKHTTTKPSVDRVRQILAAQDQPTTDPEEGSL